MPKLHPGRLRPVEVVAAAAVTFAVGMVICVALKLGEKRPLTNITRESVMLNGVATVEIFKVNVAVVGVNNSCVVNLMQLV